MVEIFFDWAWATFDDIEQDKKIKTEAQLSLIGGTMGLLTGFSIISDIEIIFFLFRYDSWIVSHIPEIKKVQKKKNNFKPVFFRLVGQLLPDHHKKCQNCPTSKSFEVKMKSLALTVYYSFSLTYIFMLPYFLTSTL